MQPVMQQLELLVGVARALPRFLLDLVRGARVEMEGSRRW